MSFIPAGYAEATINWTVATGTEPVVSVFGIDNGTALTAGGMAGVIAGAFATYLMPIMSTQISVTKIRVLSYDDTEAELEVEIPGELALDLAPPQVTHLVNKRTGFVGRINKGRWFLPGVPEENVNPGGFLTSVYRTTLNEALEDFRDHLLTTEMPMVILHAVDGEVPRQVTLLQAQNRVATLKERVR